MAGKKDTSKLVKKVITNKNGKRTTVWVKRDVSKKSKPKGIKFEEAKYPKHNQFLKTTRIFKDKDGTKHLIHLRSSDGGYLIQTEVFDNLRFNDRTDRYGNKGYYIGAEQGKDGETGFLFLSKKKGQDYYTADAGRADAMKVKEKYRRKGIATAMHKFAEEVLKLKIKPADTLSQDAKGFYGKEKKVTAKDIDKQKQELIKKVDVLIAKKKRLYGNVDITTAMSKEEKQLDKDIAGIWSEVNKLVKKKRELKDK